MATTFTFTVDRNELADVARAAAADGDRIPALTAVHVNFVDGQLTATDSYRMHQITNAIKSESGDRPADTVLLPASDIAKVAAGPAADGSGVTFTTNDSGATWQVERGRRSTTVTATDGRAPNYNQLFPDPDDETVGFVIATPDAAKSDRTDVLNVLHAAARAALTATSVTFESNGDGTVLVSWAGLSGTLNGITSPLPAGSHISLNPALLLDTITRTNSPLEVELHYRDQLKPASVRSGSARRLIMPMRSDYTSQSHPQVAAAA